MSQEKDKINQASRLDARKKRKPVPDYGRPERREIGWNEINPKFNI